MKIVFLRLKVRHRRQNGIHLISASAESNKAMISIRHEGIYNYPCDIIFYWNINLPGGFVLRKGNLKGTIGICSRTRFPSDVHCLTRARRVIRLSMNSCGIHFAVVNRFDLNEKKRTKPENYVYRKTFDQSKNLDKSDRSQ